MSKPDLLGPLEIARATADFFAEPVLQVTAPGGRTRTSFRVVLQSRSIIVTQRRDPAITNLECHVLQAFDGHCDAVPRFLGRVGTLMFQSDAGAERLNRKINSLPPEQRPALARQAVQAIFDMHRSARSLNLAQGLPSRGIMSYPDDDLIGMVQDAALSLATPIPGFDPATLDPAFRAEPRHFVKWDCRAGNAALDHSGTLRWFDFEETRRAQGPEDFAWLIADESWPLQVAQTTEIVRSLVTPDDCADAVAFMTYLEQFSALHALRRIRLILHQARRAGAWRDRVSILKYDMVGVNPVMGERLARSGLDLCARHAAIRPLIPLFARTADMFAAVREPPV